MTSPPVLEMTFRAHWRGEKCESSSSWFSKLSSCLIPFESSRPKVRLENIGNIVQVVFCSLALLVIMRRPTEAQLPFILVMISSRPILFLVQAIRTIELQDHLPAFGSILLTRRLHLEIAQLTVWILFLVGFTLYTCVSRKVCDGSISEVAGD